MKKILNWKKFNEGFGRDYIELGPTPADEPSVQVSDKVDYIENMKAECRRYIDMLNKRFPNCDKVEIKMKENSHEFGIYLEAAVYYYPDGEEQAYFIENNLPQKWTDDEILEFIPDEDFDDDDIEYED